MTGTVLGPTAFSEVFLKNWNNRKILPETRIIVASLTPSSGGTKSEGEVAHHVVWRSHGFPERRGLPLHRQEGLTTGRQD